MIHKSVVIKKDEKVMFSDEMRCNNISGYVVATQNRIVFKGKRIENGLGVYEFIGFEIQISEITSIELNAAFSAKSSSDSTSMPLLIQVCGSFYKFRGDGTKELYDICYESLKNL